MGTTATEIANAALVKIGAGKLNSFTGDTGEKAEAVRAAFDGVRDAVLQAHPWNFALRRASLPANTVSPVWGYANAFDLPTGGTSSEPFCLRVIEVEGQEKLWTWAVEGRQVLTDLDAPLAILYIGRITDFGWWSGLAMEAFEARLGMELATALGGNPTTISHMTSLFTEKMDEARAVDGQESFGTRLKANSFLKAMIS